MTWTKGSLETHNPSIVDGNQKSPERPTTGPWISWNQCLYNGINNQPTNQPQLVTWRCPDFLGMPRHQWCDCLSGLLLCASEKWLKVRKVTRISIDGRRWFLVPLPPPKTNMAIKHPPFEDVFPIRKWGIFQCHVSALRGGNLSQVFFGVLTTVGSSNLPFSCLHKKTYCRCFFLDGWLQTSRKARFLVIKEWFFEVCHFSHRRTNPQHAG